MPEPTPNPATTGQPPDPGPIIALSTAYWGAQTLLTANRLGLFALLAGGPLAADTIAARLGTDARATTLLLNAAAALGLLTRGDDGWSNSALAAAWLVPGKPTYLGDALGYSDDLYAPWGRLGEAVASGRPVLPPADYTGRDPVQTRHFVRGMHNRALGVGRALVGLVDLTGRHRLLDIGGGPGTYSALFAQRHPGLTATVLDLPGVVAVAAGIIAELGVADRVRTLAGDYQTTPFPDGQDVVLISGVLHRETAERCRDLIARAAAALVPGGLLVVSDVFTDETGTAPPFAALFGLNMLLSADDGGVHSDAAVADWLAAVGLTGIERRAFPPPLPHRVVLGVRG